MTTNRLDYLVQQALADKATPEEWIELQQLVLQQQETASLELALEKNWQNFHPAKNVQGDQLNELYAIMMDHKDKSQARVINLKRWIVAAASILLISIVGIFYASSSKKEIVVAKATSVISPGKDGAVLTLSDGSNIVLDSMNNGVVSNQSGTNVILKDRQLVYQFANTATNAPVTYNTLTTPNGRQFCITLPDGSKVWLNAASSLRFPTSFTGTERQVTITGEAFFEVAKDLKSPFIVKVNDVDIRVLGTSFNINAYPDENSISTTLVEGRVQISRGNSTSTLQPGQQLIADKTNKLTLNNEADIDQVIAWKNGLFNFEGLGIQQLMRQLERWYDIEVVYPQGIPAIQFVGKMSRNVSLPDLLEGLKGAGVNFRIENRKLIVLP